MGYNFPSKKRDDELIENVFFLKWQITMTSSISRRRHVGMEKVIDYKDWIGCRNPTCTVFK